jgi:hypothetical protein
MPACGGGGWCAARILDCVDVDAAVQRVCAMTSNVLNRTVWRQDLPNVPYTAPCAHPGHDGRLEP